MRAQFFDLSVLIELESKVWLVSRTKPSIPIVKISASEFNLIKNVSSTSRVKITLLKCSKSISFVKI